MASGQPLVLRQMAFAAKVETVAGTAVALSATDGALVIYNPKIDYEVPIIQRPSPVSMSQLTGVPGARKAKVSLTSEVAGNGSAGQPLWATTFLAASGFTNAAGVFTPTSGSATADTLSVGYYVDGRLKQAAGVATSWTMKLKAGEPGMIDWTGEGVYTAPTATALIAPTLPTVIPPRFAGATVTIGGTSYTFSSVEIACNNTIYVREDATKANGVLAAVITNRQFTVTIDPESVALGTHDFYADHLAGTEAALSIVLGASANNIITIAAPKMQLNNAPQDDEREGVLVDKLVFQCNKSANAGDDELSITFT